MQKVFTFSDIWNQSVETEPRELKKRDYCWASELGKPLVDRYLIMNATPFTNPPNTRSLRKFFAGNVWEFIAGLVLDQLGIIQEGQERVYTDSGALVVSGKLDYKIGGIPNYAKARDSINKLPFDQAMHDRFMRVIDGFEADLGTTEIKSLVYEIKSCSSFVIEKLQNGGNVIDHDMQIFHYLLGLDEPQGNIAYISKDDALMVERIIHKDSKELNDKYHNGLVDLKGYMDANEQPPAAPLIVFQNKFSKNFHVEYSQYLKLVYGFDRPDEYADFVTSKIDGWNRVLNRLVMIENGETTPTGKPIVLTDKNQEAMDAMEADGYDPKLLVETMILNNESNKTEGNE